MRPKALVFLAEGFEDVELVTVVDILRRGEVDVTVAGIAPGPTRGARGVLISPDVPLGQVAGTPFDAVVLPGGAGGAERLARSAQVKDIVVRHAREGKWVAAICSAPAMALAPWGLLEGKRATCFPGLENRFPPSATFVAEPVVVDGNLVTSRALGTALAFSLALLEHLCGKGKAADVRKAVMA